MDSGSGAQASFGKGTASFLSSMLGNLRAALRSKRFPICVAALFTILLSAQLRAYTTEWQWRVTGDSMTFKSKGEAIARMKSLGPNHPKLTVEQKVGLTTSGVTYKYTAPLVEPVMSAWSYWVSAPNGVPYSSESAAIEARRAHLQAIWPQCPSPTVTATGSWTDTAWVFSDPGFPTNSKRTLQISGVTAYTNGPNGMACYPVSYSPWTEQMTRTRSWNCPASYSPTATYPYCQLPLTANIEGHPLTSSCEVVGGNTCHGNPIDAATGDKAQSETDYRGAGLSFTRTYHSQTLETAHRLGSGWTHNFAGKIVIPPGGVPNGLARPNGVDDILRSVGSNHFITETGSGLQLKKVGVEWVLYLNDGAREIYDSNGTLLRLVDPSGKTTTLNYTNGILSSVAGPYGHSLQFVYVSGRISEVLNPAGLAIAFNYDANNNLTGVSYPDGTTRTYHYEHPTRIANLTGITDELSVRFSTYGYDSDGRADSTSYAGGVGLYTFVHQANSTVVTDPSGASITYSYATEDRARRVTSRSKSGLTDSYVVPNYSIDFQRRPTQATDPKGYVTKYSYNQDHLTSKTEAFLTPVARTTSYLYRSTNEDLPTQIDEPGRRTSHTYDSYANVLTRTVTDLTVSPNASRTWTYTYSGTGQMLTADGPRTDVSDVTTYTYYNCTAGAQCGQLHTVANPLGHGVTYNAYNAHAQPTQFTDDNGLVTTIAYDLRQRVTDRCVGGFLPSCVGGELTHIDYWPTGLLKKVTNPDGSYLEYAYDAAHRLTEVKDGALNRIVYTLDNAGNRTAENSYDPSNALRRTHSRVYNSLNQLWKDVNAAGTAAVTTTFGYDNNGNQTTTAAPLSRNSTSAYDELNRLKQITDPGSGTTYFGYDALHNLTSVTDPRSLITIYGYNGLGDLTTLTSPDTGLTTNTYDSGGNLDTSTDSRGAIADYSYDVNNRVTSVSFTLGGVTDQTIYYGYDAGTNQKGRLTSAWDADHSLAWNYDSQGRVTGKGQTVGTTTLAIGYGYDSAGRLGTVTLPSGNVVTYGYNTNGQVTSVTLNGSTTILSGITYDPFGPITGWTWGNGTSASRGFDTDGKITQVDNANGASLTNYGYDDAFRITSITDAANSTLSWTYGYDLLDRLNSATSSSVTQGWTYDANGNRLTQTGTTPSTFTNSATSNRLSSTTGSLARTYGYDNAGNTLSYAGATFTYNNRGRMATASSGGVTAVYTYNALAQRARRVTSMTATLYMYDEAGNLVGEYNAAGNLEQETIWLGNMPIANLRSDGASGTTLFYVHSDHLKTPRLVSDTNNNIRWRWDSDAFGTTMPDENPSGLGLFKYNLRFRGQVFDERVGLHYNYYRDYDPAVAKYQSSDPIGLRAGINTYSYVRSRPLSKTDSKGLCDECEPERAHMDSMVDVARREVANFIAASIADNVEYCGWICQDNASGRYFAMPGKIASDDQDDPRKRCQPMFLEDCPKCSTRRALWHTHGQYSYDKDGNRIGDEFSEGPMADTGSAHMLEVDAFLGTPGGDLLQYHRVEDRVTNWGPVKQ